MRDAGTYEAYALFDEGAGFAPTALAHATVEVKAAAKTPKTGDLSPLALGGFALVALLGAGALALTACRRRRD